VLPPQLRSSLHLTQLVALFTLVRSIAYDRWITVLGSVLLIIGATAALRHRTWGVGLALAAASAFPVAWAIGIAPSWFCLVGLAGALPFAHSWRAFARFDRAAATLFAMLATTGGLLTAVLWKEYAVSVFNAIPALSPSGEANHLTLLGVSAAGATLAMLTGLRAGGCSHVRARIGSEPLVRVSADEVEEEEEEATERSRRTL
jgi:uncharacterized membrane protein (UPF0136 family)